MQLFKKAVLCVFYGLFIGQAHAQSSTCHVPQIPSENGLYYYYFWEEDSQGNIIDSTFKTPFSCNELILLDTLKNKHTRFSQNLIMHSVFHARKLKWDKHNSVKFNRINFCRLNTDASTIVYIKKNGNWYSYLNKRVLVFTVENALKKFNTSRSYIHWKNTQIPITYNTFCEWNYLESSAFKYARITGFKGDDLSNFANSKCQQNPKKYLIIANGYRGPAYDKWESRNEVYANDRTNYWFKIDNRFISRLKPDTTLYIDGSFSVKTSNHFSKLKFAWSFLCASKFSSKNSSNYKILNSSSNDEGFMYRYEKGKIAGQVFLHASTNFPLKQSKDTIDFVCHSMGYAYMLGFLEAVEHHVVLNHCYIIAPENASFKGFDWSKFREVWQYGSNLDQPNPDKLREQDGVAPQSAVKGLSDYNPQHYGRCFPPNNWPNKQFIHSHMVYSYDWIFDRILKGQKGYIIH